MSASIAMIQLNDLSKVAGRRVLLAILAGIIGCGAKDRTDHAEPNGDRRGVTMNKHLRPLSAIAAALDLELRGVTVEDAFEGSYRETLVEAIKSTSVADHIRAIDSRRLESVLIRYGRDPAVQLLGVTLLVSHSPESEKICTIIAMSESLITENSFFTALLMPLSGEWTTKERSDISNLIDNGLRAPASPTVAKLLSVTIPLDTLVALLVHDRNSTLRSSDWDAVFLSGINIAIAEGRLDADFADRGRVDTIAIEMLSAPDRSVYEAMWYLQELISDDQCVRYLNEFQSQLDDVEIVAFARRFEKQLRGITAGTVILEDRLRLRLRALGI